MAAPAPTQPATFPFLPPNSVVLEEAKKRDTKLYDVPVSSHQVPIIYSSEYNITLFGLEKLHPFDSGKWGKVIQILKDKKLLVDSSYIHPREASKHDLLRVHKQRYINSLKWSVNVARITEIAPAACLPNCVLQRALLKPFRFQTGGSILAGRCAVERGWSINIGGGFHHCSSGRGGGFCAYADITLSIQFAMEHYDHINKVLIVDLDAHQGNGHERDFMDRKDIYILDIYNRLIYPKDEQAKKAITRRVELSPYTEDPRYLKAVDTHVEGALNEFKPDLVVYNAGTDVLEGDPLGLLSVSKQGIITRDEIVWQKVRQRNIPLIMLTSGGYQRATAAIIADSIANLHRLSLIDLKPSTVMTSASGSHVQNNVGEFSSPSPPPIAAKYGFLSRCAGGMGGGRKKSLALSASECTTPLSGRHSITDSNASSPPPPSGTHSPPPTTNSEPITHQPPSYINLAPSHMRQSIVSEESAEYSTPKSATHPPIPPDTPAPSTSTLHPVMTQQISLTDSVTPPSPAYRSVCGSMTAVSTPPHHKSVDSTLSAAQTSSHHTGGSITTPPSHYESADSINLSGSFVSNNAFVPP